MIRLVVYTTGDRCVQCQLTKRVMDAVGLRYTDIDLTDPANEAARQYVTEDLGYARVPVVVVDDHHHWSGFEPDRIKDLAARFDDGPESGLV